MIDELNSINIIENRVRLNSKSKFDEAVQMNPRAYFGRCQCKAVLCVVQYLLSEMCEALLLFEILSFAWSISPRTTLETENIIR